MLYFTYTHREELLFQSYIYFIINDHLKVFQEELFQTVTTLSSNFEERFSNNAKPNKLISFPELFQIIINPLRSRVTRFSLTSNFTKRLQITQS